VKSPAHFRRDGRAFERPEVGEPAGPRSTRVAREAGFCEGCEVTPVKSPALPPAEVARNAQGRDKCRAGVPWPVREALTNSDATALRIFTKAGRGDFAKSSAHWKARPGGLRPRGPLELCGWSAVRRRGDLRGYPCEVTGAIPQRRLERLSRFPARPRGRRGGADGVAARAPRRPHDSTRRARSPESPPRGHEPEGVVGPGPKGETRPRRTTGGGAKAAPKRSPGRRPPCKGEKKTGPRLLYPCCHALCSRGGSGGPPAAPFRGTQFTVETRTVKSAPAGSV